jgi:excinuclease UvrABC nuclease subunit
MKYRRRRTSLPVVTNDPSQHVVYECYGFKTGAPGEGRDGPLLYLGYTNDLHRRLTEHANRSIWWDRVALVRFEAYDTEHEARLWETSGIRVFKPLFNIQGQRAEVSA